MSPVLSVSCSTRVYLRCFPRFLLWFDQFLHSLNPVALMELRLSAFVVVYPPASVSAFGSSPLALIATPVSMLKVSSHAADEVGLS